MTLCVQIGTEEVGPSDGDAITALTARPGGADAAGSTQLALVKEGGGGWAFLNKQVVSVFDKTAGGTYGRRARTFAGGYVDRPEAGQLAGGTLKTWAIDVTDFNTQLNALVTDAAWATALHVTSDDFPGQIEQAVNYFGTGAANPIDGINGVLDLFPGVTLDAAVYPDQSLGEILQDIADRAVSAAAPTTVVPRFCIRPDNTPNTLILDPDFPLGQPVLYVWDGAAPQGPVMEFSDDPVGDERSISVVELPRRLLDSAGMVQRRYLTLPGTSHMFVGLSAASVATYPNPANGRADHAWRGKALKAPEWMDLTTAQAFIDGQVERSGYPLETLYLTSDDAEDQPPLPGQTVTVTWALLALDHVPYEVAATSYAFWWSASGGLRVRVTLTLGLAQRRLGQPGRFGGARIPVIAVPPDVPSGLGHSTAYNYTERRAYNTYTWTLPANLTGIVGYAVYETTPAPGGPTYRNYVAGASVTSLAIPDNPGQTFSAVVRAVGVNGLESVDSNTTGPFTSASAVVPTTPGQPSASSAFNPNTGHPETTFSWTASTAGPGLVISAYYVHVDGGGQNRTYLVVGNPAPTTYVDVNEAPNTAYTAYIVAQDNAQQQSAASATRSFTSAAIYDPDPPTSLAVHSFNIERFGSSGWVRLQFTPPGTTHGPHDTYEVEMTGGGQVQTFDYPDPGGSPTILPAIHGLTLGVQYSLRVRTISSPGWFGSSYAGPVTVTVKGGGPPPNLAGGGEPAGDQPLFPYEKSAGTGTPTVDPSDPFEGGAAYKFLSTGLDTQTVIGLPFATVEGRTWTVRTAAKKSGGSPTLAGQVQWSTDGTAWNVLTASTLTLPALTTSWPAGYTEQQVKAPSTTNWGRLVYTAAFAAALSILASLPQPTPAQGIKDLDLQTGPTQPLIIRDVSDGSDQAELYATSPQNLIIQGINSGRAALTMQTYGGAAGISVSDTGSSLYVPTNQPIQISTGGTGAFIIVGAQQFGTQRETRGSSPPASPSDDDRWYYTPGHEWYYYDSGPDLWLSEGYVPVILQKRQAAEYYNAGAEAYMGAAPPVPLYLEAVDLGGYIASHDMSNYWTWRFSGIAAGNSLSDLATADSYGNFANAEWDQYTLTSFSGNPYDAGDWLVFELVLDKVSSPGDMIIAVGVRARKWIAP